MQTHALARSAPPVPVASALARVAATAGHSDYARVARAIAFLVEHAGEQPSLARTAAEVGLSEFHFQRLFSEWAGVSPKRLLAYLTLGRARRLLGADRSLLETSLEVGLSGPGRLHDLFLSIERMTPGEYKQRAAGLTIDWGFEPTPLGPALIATLAGPVCSVWFVDPEDGSDGGGEAGALRSLAARWPRARLRQKPEAVREAGQALRERLDGQLDRPLGLVLRGTPLQLQVWEALLRIPRGAVAAYGEVARLVGAAGAARAVGNAVADNQLAVLIPCHRVLRSTGAFGGYRWGSARKVALLCREQPAP